MGKIKIPEKVKLIAGLISNDTVAIEKAGVFLEKKIKNKIDFESSIMEFNHTDYYNEEMGGRLKRKFLSFKKTVPLNGIEKIKLISNAIEMKFSMNSRRIVNIDPGYLDMSKLVLFSTKDYSHRIHVGAGIFAEVTLYYKDGIFTSWPWTYPDYRTPEYASIFNSIRELYREGAKKRAKICS